MEKTIVIVHDHQHHQHHTIVHPGKDFLPHDHLTTLCQQRYSRFILEPRYVAQWKFISLNAGYSLNDAQLVG